jgi:hypothetical protein
MDLEAVTEDDLEAAGQLLAASFVEAPAPVWWRSEPEVRAEFAPHFSTAVNYRAERDGVGVYLDTLTAGNVAFYERRGYRVVGETDIAGSDVHARGMRFH